jgi:UDP-glucose 4-epimerase
MKKVLITGSTGFIGKVLIQAINSEIRIISRLDNPDYETIICDLYTDEIPIKSVNGIDTIFHLAGVAHDISGNYNKDYYNKINVDATIQLAKLAVKSEVKRFVFVSSVKAGANLTSNSCWNEDGQGGALGVYGETKRKAELELLKISANSNMHVSIIRPSLVYGPNVKGNLKMMLHGIDKGWFPAPPETGNRRSMIHVDDLVEAILLVSNDKRANREIFILTDGISYSTRKIYNIMRVLVGKREVKWSIPRKIFNIVGLLSPRFKFKLDKLFGNECYCSKKIEELGFRAKKTLENMNETDY